MVWHLVVHTYDGFRSLIPQGFLSQTPKSIEVFLLWYGNLWYSFIKSIHLLTWLLFRNKMSTNHNNDEKSMILLNRHKSSWGRIKSVCNIHLSFWCKYSKHLFLHCTFFCREQESMQKSTHKINFECKNWLYRISQN